MVLGTLIVISTLVTGSDPGRSPALEQEKSAVQTSAEGEAAAIRQRVKENQKVRIIDDQGREWHGRIEALTPDTLMLVIRDRKRMAVPYGTIVRIDRPHDGVGNGAGIGFVAGAMIGLLAVISAECNPAGYMSCGAPGGAAYVAPLVFGGVGAGIGAGVDALIRREGNLWRRGDARVAMAPALGRGVRALRVSVRW